MRNIAFIGLFAVLVTGLCLQHYRVQALRAEVRALRNRLEQAPAAPEAPSNPAGAGDSHALPDEQFKELLRLRNEVARLRGAPLEPQAQAPAPVLVPAVAQAEAERAWVQQIVNSPPASQGRAAGALRGKLLRREATNIVPAELLLQEELQQKQLNLTLERSPAAFADFQGAFIQSTLGLQDENRVRQIHDIIQQTYEHAVANQLDIPSKPASEAGDWVQRRYALDRAATAQVQRLLTPEERRAFDRAFLGVMGVDLGVGVDKSNYPRSFLGDVE